MHHVLSIVEGTGTSNLVASRSQSYECNAIPDQSRERHFHYDNLTIEVRFP
jgi:hypothetical protein